MTRLGLEPRTSSVLRRRDNQLHHQAIVLSERNLLLLNYISLYPCCGESLLKFFTIIKDQSGLKLSTEIKSINFLVIWLKGYIKSYKLWKLPTYLPTYLLIYIELQYFV